MAICRLRARVQAEGGAGSVGLLGLAVAFGGDAEATAANMADSGNSQTVSNSLVTGDATAQNFTGVVATQTNMNKGDAGALDGLALIGIAIGGIVQYNGAYVVADDNYAEASTGYNAQIGGFQGNGTIQGAGAIAGGGWAGALRRSRRGGCRRRNCNRCEPCSQHERQHGDQRPRDR